MAGHDWYRNKSWDADTEAAFRAKLSRSRSSRPQYLQIQAGYLVDNYPATALSLIEEYFATGDDFHVPSALCVRAKAHQALGEIDNAIEAYKQALSWEKTHPGYITTARIELPKLVAYHRLSNEYEYAQEILADRFEPSDFSFPSFRYLWNGSSALIAKELGHFAEAQEFAERALRAVAETESPFRYHRNTGVVRDISGEFGQRIKRIARPSTLRSLLRLVSRS